MNSQTVFAVIVFFTILKIVFSSDDPIFEDANRNFEITTKVRGLTIKCFNDSIYLPDFLNDIPSTFYTTENFQKIENETFKIIIDGCELNPSKVVIDVITETLRINSTEIHFENLKQEITRKNLQTKTINELEFSNSTLNFATDLLHDHGDLKNFFIHDSNITEIPNNFFQYSKNLKLLEFCNTQIRKFNHNDFSKLHLLKSLTLEGNNELIEIHPMAFDDLEALETLKIQNNINLMNLPPAIFKNLKNLEELHLSGNSFNDLSSDLIKNLKLKSFTFSNNHGNLSSLPDGFFGYSKELKDVEMINNRFTSVPKDLFSETKSLKKLILSNNCLTSLPQFQNMLNMTELNLAYNNLTEININFCHEALLVRILDLSHNNIINLPKCDIDSSYGRNACQKLNRGKLNVNLKHNNISEINLNTIVNSYGGCFDFNLSSNSLDKISIDYNYPPLLSLNESVKSVIDLKGVQIECDCNLINLIRFFDENYENLVKEDLKKKLNILYDSLKCKSRPGLENESVSKINVDSLYCKESKCAKNCSCFNNPLSKTLKMNCANIGLNSLDVSFLSSFENTKNYSIELNLSNNNLTATPDLNSADTFLRDVTFLNLSSNKILQVTTGVFSKKLRVLILDHNELSVLNDETLNELYNRMSKNFTLTLHDNPWICDCKNFELVDFIFDHRDKIIDHRKIKCRDSSSEVSAQNRFMTCYLLYLIIVVIILTFGTMLGIIAAYYYKNKKKILIWLYSKNYCLRFVTEDELDEDKEFDAFVSFSHLDENFVEELTEKLENDPVPYKLCLHHRDWLAGNWIDYQIIRSVEESKRTIIVLSRNFIESDWALKEFRIALTQAETEKRIRVIVIKYGDIGNVDELDDELKSYIKTRTYIEWGDPWFWDKLKYALPHKYKRKRQKIQNDKVENQSESIPLQSEVQLINEPSKDTNTET